MKTARALLPALIFVVLFTIAAPWLPKAHAQSDTISNGLDDSVTPSKVRRMKTDPSGNARVNPAAQLTGRTSEVLVLTTCTTMPSLSGRRSLGLQNCGPNDITCFLATSCGAVATGISVPAKASGLCGFFAMDISDGIPVRCIATTAAQVTTAATIVIELGP